MGAFCVFGVSRQALRKTVENKIPTWRFEGEERIELTVQEWSALVAAEVERLFAESEKLVRISPELDAPQFCRDWIAVSPAEVRLAQIMVRGPKVDGDGIPVVRKGAPVMVWQPYSEPTVQPRLVATAAARVPEPAC